MLKESFLPWRGRKSRTFTLQWHLTNLCEQHCRHCYDRTRREVLPFEECLRIIDDLESFGKVRRVYPKISLSGGDPLLHPDFWRIYSEIARRRIAVSILGNPITGATLDRLLEIAAPGCYQVSLEGLREYNDHIRGNGHYDRVMEFLREARSRGVHLHVMLTLNKDNLDQVLPLGEGLRGLVDRFTFNRLARTGEGEQLAHPDKAEFVSFLSRYMAARRSNPVLGAKDNLFNILRHDRKQTLLPGCTGFGCGAAFNFVALLPDGQVHACRKYPSPVGDIRHETLAQIYDSPAALLYRHGSEACRGCVLKRSCGGCPAFVYGEGLNPLSDRDPFCFFHGI